MAQALIKIEVPLSTNLFKLPKAVNNRLQQLLDRQDQGKNCRLLKEKKRKD